MARRKVKITYDNWGDVHDVFTKYGKVFDMNYSQVYRWINEEAVPMLQKKIDEKLKNGK